MTEKDLKTARELIQKWLDHIGSKESVDTNLVFAIAEALDRVRMERSENKKAD